MLQEKITLPVRPMWLKFDALASPTNLATVEAPSFQSKAGAARGLIGNQKAR